MKLEQRSGQSSLKKKNNKSCNKLLHTLLYNKRKCKSSKGKSYEHIISKLTELVCRGVNE